VPRELSFKGKDSKELNEFITQPNVIAIYPPATKEKQQLLEDYVKAINSNKTLLIKKERYAPINNILKFMGLTEITKDTYLIADSEDDPRYNIFKSPIGLELIKRGFSNEYTKKIYSFYSKYENFKEPLSENEDYNLNLHRLEFVKVIIDFVKKEYKLAFYKPDDAVAATDAIIGEIYDFHNDLLINISVKALEVLTELTGDFKNKFKSNLGDNFSWEKFEHLGGILQYHKYRAKGPIMDPKNKDHHSAIKSFILEIAHRKDIIGIAFKSIKKDDFSQLSELLDLMIKYFQDNTLDTSVLKMNLIASTTLISRVLDQESLRNLHALCANDVVLSEPKEVLSDKNNNRHLLTSIPITIDDKVDFSLSINKQAMLNDLIKIGELCTSKYLSSKSQKLSIPELTRYLVDIRNAIEHQSAEGNKRRVQELVNDQNYLNELLKEIRTKLANYFTELFCKHYNSNTSFKPDINSPEAVNAKVFWDQLYNEAKVKVPLEPSKPKEYSKEQKDILKLVNANVLLTAKLKEVFSGKVKIDESDKISVKNTIAKCKPNRRSEAILSFHEALLQTEKQYPDLLYNWKKEFPYIDTLYTKFYTPNGKYLPAKPLNPLQKIEAAIEAIDNIEGILDTCKVTRFNNHNVDEWIKKNTLALRNIALSTLDEKDKDAYRKLSALQYNVCQCLGYIESFKKEFDYKLFENYNSIGSQYSDLRNKRNYLTHGNRFFDKPDYSMFSIFDINPKKGFFIVNSAINLIVEIKKELETLQKSEVLKEILLLRQVANKKTEWTNYIIERSKKEHYIGI
jgi:hypothetical protein